MLKRLHIILFAVLCCSKLFSQNVFNPADPVITYDAAAAPGTITNPNVPAEGVMAKWIRTKRVNWNTDNFKCYIFDGMPFRLRFPNNYNPANKYPVLLFFHGGGEKDVIYRNELNLTWGAQLFEQRINNGEWNGFMLFPQSNGVGWDESYFSRINNVLDTLQKYNNLDPDRLITMGLSEGGYGATAYTSAYPQRVAASLVACPVQIRTLAYNMPSFVHVPIWMANGGLDNVSGGDPWNMFAFFQGFRNEGGNIYQTYFATIGHNDPWTPMWNQKTPSGAFLTDVYWNTAHKAQPLLYYENQQACAGTAIASRMGITTGYYAYQWQKDGATIAGANSNEYTATQAGAYRVRFMRKAGGYWSDWTPNPVVISTKACAVDTLFAEHFTNDNYYNAAPGYTISNFSCQTGIMTTATEAFTQDATGVKGGRFLLHYTGGSNGCTYAAGDRVWNTYQPLTVLPNTNYEFSFYVGNQTSVSPAQLVPTINGTPLINGFVQATGTGNASWQKFTFAWNSGAFTYADLGIVNKLATATGNDFAIDEISFKLASTPVPDCITNIAPANGATVATDKTATLQWTKAANAASYDLYLWKGDTPPATPTATIKDTVYKASGLTPVTSYNWYVVPKNSNGITSLGCGNRQTSFITAATPVAPSCIINASPANAVKLSTANTATLTWPAAATATSYDVYLWKGTATPSAPVATTTATSYNASGLTAETLYNWYVVPKNAVGAATGCNSNKTSFTTTIQFYTDSLPDIADAYVRNGSYANTNYGQAGQLVLKNDGTNYNRESYVKFDLRSLRGNLQSAKLRLNLEGTNTSGASTSWTILKLSNNTWTETGITWNNRPSSTETIATIPAKTTPGYYEWDILDELKNSAGDSVISFRIISTTPGPKTDASFSSRENSNASLRPSIVYTYLPAAPVIGTGTGLKVDLFNNVTLTGNPVVSAINTTVNANWGTNSPTKGVNADLFSIRWTGQVQAQYSETYTFITTSDDGVRLWVNGQQLINNWTAHGPTVDKGIITLVAGVKYNIVMEYYDAGGAASIQLAWSSPSTKQTVIPQTQLYPVSTPITGTGTGLKADMFNNTALTGNTVASRTDATVNFGWGTGSPAAGISADRFSIRWTGQVQAQYAEAYTFYATSDDGIRVWVNGQQLINNWADHAPVENSGTITLFAGAKYDITIEYHESTGSATAILAWSSASTPKTVIPKTQLYPPETALAAGRMAVTEDASLALQSTNLAENNTVINTNNLKTGIYPNPVLRGQNAVLQINSDMERAVAMQVLNVTGNIVQNQRFNVVPGANTKSISTSALTPGIYIIRITGNAAQPIILKLLVE